VTGQPAIDGRRAQSFGGVAAEYDRGRPGYSADAVRWLLGDDPLDVVDLGAGTGKLTSALRMAGHHVTAVEPLREMRAVLRANLPDVTVVDARAEDSGLPDASADAVVAGAAFHWFEWTRVFPEIVRIIRPRGLLGLLGSRLDQSVPVASRIREALGDGHRQAGLRNWPDADELGRWFVEVDEVRTFPYTHSLDRDRLQDLALSHSRLAVLPPDERERALRRLAAFWDADPELAGQDSVQIAYLTVVLRARWPHHPSPSATEPG
jgi:SAM-dependent methyltransferase